MQLNDISVVFSTVVFRTVEELLQSSLLGNDVSINKELLLLGCWSHVLCCAQQLPKCPVPFCLMSVSFSLVLDIIVSCFTSMIAIRLMVYTIYTHTHTNILSRYAEVYNTGFLQILLMKVSNNMFL